MRAKVSNLFTHNSFAEMSPYKACLTGLDHSPMLVRFPRETHFAVMMFAALGCYPASKVLALLKPLNLRSIASRHTSTCGDNVASVYEAGAQSSLARHVGSLLGDFLGSFIISENKTVAIRSVLSSRVPWMALFVIPRAT